MEQSVPASNCQSANGKALRLTLEIKNPSKKPFSAASPSGAGIDERAAERSRDLHDYSRRDRAARLNSTISKKNPSHPSFLLDT
jgi:hypothetical protein